MNNTPDPDQKGMWNEGVGPQDGKDSEKNEPDSKWRGHYTSEAERAMLKEARDNKVIRDIERGETRKDTQIKRIKIVLFAFCATIISAIIGAILPTPSSPVLWGAPFAAGILAWIVNKYKLNRMIGALLFLIPGLMALPEFFISMSIIGWGALVGLMSEDKYKQY